MEQLTGTVKAIQNLIDNAKELVWLFRMEFRTEPIDIDNDKNYADGTEKIHDFR